MSRRKLRDSADASRLSSSFAEDERGIHYAKSTMKFPRFAHVCLLNQSIHPDDVYLNGMGKWARSNLVALDHTEASVPKLLTKSHWAGWQKKFGELILDQICIQPRCFPVSWSVFRWPLPLRRSDNKVPFFPICPLLIKGFPLWTAAYWQADKKPQNE